MFTYLQVTHVYLYFIDFTLFGRHDLIIIIIIIIITYTWHPYFSLDVEGWHHRLNKKTAAKKGFYNIVTKVLYKEVEGMDTMLRMVSEEKLSKRQTRKSKTVHYQINKMWTKYEQNQLSVNGVLKKVSKIYNSVMNWCKLWLCKLCKRCMM